VLFFYHENFKLQWRILSAPAVFVLKHETGRVAAGNGLPCLQKLFLPKIFLERKNRPEKRENVDIIQINA
jgi:hypothetical protein